ncbi:MAG: energy transducer TonB [Nitrospinae bacterium]|nr:energy transducer TonB [Nitrospinota bacterium]
MSFSLILTILVSIALHMGLILLAPAVKLPTIFAKQPERMEVDLVRREVPIPEALLPKVLPEVPLPEPLDLNHMLQKQSMAERDLNLDVKTKLVAPDPGVLPESEPLPDAPALDMPKPVLAPGEIPSLGALQAGETVDEIVLPVDGKTKVGESRGLKRRKKVALPGSEADRKMLEQLSRLSDSRSSRQQKRTNIAGPAARRRILFQPKPPKLERLEITTEIVLKFWVLPDGTVGRVIPTRKASAYLEGLASNHLKRWRFSPLPPGAEDKEQWGEITFRFLLN